MQRIEDRGRSQLLHAEAGWYDPRETKTGKEFSGERDPSFALVFFSEKKEARARARGYRAGLFGKRGSEGGGIIRGECLFMSSASVLSKLPGRSGQCDDSGEGGGRQRPEDSYEVVRISTNEDHRGIRPST